MPFLVTEEYKSYWLRALTEELGLGIRCEPKTSNLVMQDLYETRRAMNDPRLEVFRIIHLKDGTLMIVRKETSLEDEHATPLS